MLPRLGLRMVKDVEGKTHRNSLRLWVLQYLTIMVSSCSLLFLACSKAIHCMLSSGPSHRIWATAWSGAAGPSGVYHPSWMPMEGWRTSWWRMSCFLLARELFFKCSMNAAEMRQETSKTWVVHGAIVWRFWDSFGWFERMFVWTGVRFLGGTFWLDELSGMIKEKTGTGRACDRSEMI